MKKFNRKQFGFSNDPRALRLEALESRQMLSATPMDASVANEIAIVAATDVVDDVVDVSDRMRFRGNMEILGPDPNKKEMVRAKQERREPVYDLTFFLNRQKELKEKAAQEKKE